MSQIISVVLMIIVASMLGWIVGLVGQNGLRGLFAGIAIFVACISVQTARLEPLNSPWNSVVVVVWTIGPPLYFLVEYTAAGKIQGTELDYLKYSQELASKFWAGFAALLFSIYASRGWLPFKYE